MGRAMRGSVRQSKVDCTRVVTRAPRLWLTRAGFHAKPNDPGKTLRTFCLAYRPCSNALSCFESAYVGRDGHVGEHQ